MKRNKCSCVICKEIITTNNLNKHHERCKIKGGKVKPTLPKPVNMNCDHCGKTCLNLNSLRQHEVRCRKNKDRVFIKDNLANYREKYSNGEVTKIKLNQWSDPDYKISSETRIRLSESSKKTNENRWKNESNRLENSKKMSTIMKKVVEDHPDSYTSSNRGRTKQIEKYGIKFQGWWEVTYYEWCKINNINVQRNTKRFPYEWNGTRSYNPDFYLPDTNEYVEVKGYETDRDRAKWRDFPHKLIIIRKRDIEEMKKFLSQSLDR